MRWRMEYIDCDIIKSFFEVLNVSGLKYALIRNTGGELPDRLQDGKDISIEAFLIAVYW